MVFVAQGIKLQWVDACRKTFMLTWKMRKSDKLDPLIFNIDEI